MKELKQQADKLFNIIKNAQKISIITHVNPDGDAIGSSAGLLGVLEKFEKDPVLIVPNEFPAFLKWMKNAENAIVFNKEKKKATETIRSSDLIVCLDFNDLDRMDKVREAYNASEAIKILIDHHPDPQSFADFIISETEVSSASELVYHLVKLAGETDKIDTAVAGCLLAGIMTDTGCFIHGQMTRATYEALSTLVDRGAKKDEIYSFLYDNYSFDRMQLQGYVLLKKMVHVQEFRTAYIWLTDKELKAFNYVPGDTEGFVNLPFAVKGVEITALFIENKDHIKVSLRSKGNIAINRLAKEHFNGGGHLNAAGGDYYGSMEDTIKTFINLLPGYAQTYEKI